MPTVTRRDPRRHPGRGRLMAAALLLAATVSGACSVHGPARSPETNSVEVPTVHHGPPTLFGSNVWEAPGESRADAAARADATYGRLPVTRVFSSWLPDPWPDLERDLGHRALVVSFRLRPSRVLSGSEDDRLAAWFRSAPRNRDTYWVYYHEPEAAVDRGIFTADAFVAAWDHVAALAAAAGNPRLHATVVLMCWTAQPRSGRDWRDYVSTSGAVEVLAWDCYAKGDAAASYVDPATLLGSAREASGETGAAWGIAELGARTQAGSDGTDRARWLADVGAYARAGGARFVTYFDAPVGGEFRLLDAASVASWSRLVRSSGRRARGERP